MEAARDNGRNQVSLTDNRNIYHRMIAETAHPGRDPLTCNVRWAGQVCNRGEARAVTVVDWLLDSDPSIRWQVMRDLTHEPDEAVAAERARVATEGWVSPGEKGS